MILQLNPQILVQTPLGPGYTFLIIDYGQWVNTCWVVRLNNSGEVKHFDSNDIKIEGNFTVGEKILFNQTTTHEVQ